MRPVEVAYASWRRLDCAGAETCRLLHVQGGWMLRGHARFNDGHVVSALEYSVHCDAGWATTRAEVSGLVGAQSLRWQIARDGDGWWLNGLACPGLEACVDIDLGFSPATNLLPLRRLDPAVGEAVHLAAAWFRWPEARLERRDQTYAKQSDHSVAYRAPGFATELRIDPGGFVTLYPDHWEGEVTYAA